MLNLAFANDILNNISVEELRSYISGLVDSKLKSVARPRFATFYLMQL